jgi:ATP-dependent RNA helicase DeaD
MVKRFDEFNIKPVLKNGLSRMNYSTATEVQDESFSVMMGSKNVVVKSFTGSGKTLAFGIPLSERLLRKDSNAVIIIGPTRELVIQVNKELQALNKFTRMKIFPVYGGHGITGEVMELRKKFHILCATPGRLLDHLQRGNLKHIDVDTVVLDEGDLMLDMGFQEDINKILKMVRPKNVHLFSATMEGKVTQVIKEHIKHYELIDIKTEIIGEKILEENHDLNPEQKFPKLLEYIHKSKGKILIFSSTKRYTEVLKERLDKEGIKCRTIHSDITQAKRENALREFKTGKIKILIATDVASRGLHIDDVEYVINYDTARTSEIHKHRIGRTGRMGKIGNAITFNEVRKRRRKDRTDGYMPRHKRDSEENNDGKRRRARENGEESKEKRENRNRRGREGKENNKKREKKEYSPNKKLNKEKHSYTIDKKKEKLHKKFESKDKDEKKEYNEYSKPKKSFKSSTRAKVRSRFSKFKKR